MTVSNPRDGRTSNELLDAFATRFVNRKQPYAVQQEDGTYRWRYEALTSATVLAHLRGELTLALSSSDGNGSCRWLCLDVDTSDGLRQLLALNKALLPLGLPGLVEASRRGGHLWLFLDGSLPVVAARTRVVKALDHLRGQEVAVPETELYPDVGTAAHAGLGHAVRLPLGIHRLSGRRYALFDEYGLPWAIRALVRYVPDTEKERPEPPKPPRKPARRLTPAQRRAYAGKPSWNHQPKRDWDGPELPPTASESAESSSTAAGKSGREIEMFAETDADTNEI